MNRKDKTQLWHNGQKEEHEPASIFNFLRNSGANIASVTISSVWVMYYVTSCLFYLLCAIHISKILNS